MDLHIPAEERNPYHLGEREQPSANHRTKPKAARDVPTGTSWAFTNHRTVAQVIVAGLL